MTQAGSRFGGGPGKTYEECSKPWLVLLHKGLYYPCTYMGVVINQSVYIMECHKGFERCSYAPRF